MIQHGKQPETRFKRRDGKQHETRWFDRRDGKQPETRSKMMKYRVVLCGIGTAFLALGIYRGEAASVLMKSVRICLECVGIG